MKATKLAYLYNTCITKASAYHRLVAYFVQQYSVLIQQFTTNNTKEQAKLYIRLRIKWTALCLRTNLSEKHFQYFMLKNYPFEVNRVLEYLAKQ